ncbi:hypothetical protein [Caldovatus aquaticus]|uniref:Uncharacterized protein n=1 Tax=Caldovatus aquaticus TaxID=2865671 RepID=A0ABS7EYD1_9PROT|nr:hypothetical protein [Caldovatus aquaticus]MBW8268367.1 hypothetical protein [Caldovatus aquaticus]
MHDCLQDTVRRHLVRFLRIRLARRVVLDGRELVALAETAAAPAGEGDVFCTDSNAKAAELLSHPALWNEDPDLAAGLFDFLLAMGGQDCPGAAAPLLPRRLIARPPAPGAGVPPAARIEILSDDPRDFAIRTPMHDYAGDLSRGLVVQSVRSAGPGAPMLRHTGNLFEVTHQGRYHCVDVEDAITAFGLERTATGGVRLHHAGPVRVPGKEPADAPVQLGTLRYEYAIEPEHPALLRLTVSFTPEPGVAGAISRLRLTTACDELSPTESQAFGAILVDPPASAGITPGRFAGLPPGTTTVLEGGGAAALIALVQEGRPPGFGHGVYLRPRDPDRMVSLTATVRSVGLHWLLTRYGADSLQEQESLVVCEDRLLVGGGLHDDAAARGALMARAEAGPPGLDLSLCLDQGAVLNAVATHLLLAAGGHYVRPPPPERLDRLRAWCERRIEAYFDALAPERPDAPRRVYARELAFVALALDCLWRLGGEARHRRRLGQAVDLLLGLLRDAHGDDPGAPPEAAFRDAWSGVAYLDCHAAAMLALARVALHRDDPRLGPALRRALGALRLATGEIAEDGRGVVFDSLAVRCWDPERGTWTTDIAAWSYKLALLLRALRAMQAALAAGAIELAAEEAARLRFLATLCLDLLRDRIGLAEDALEVRLGPRSGAANVEAQAWTVLALMPTDAPIARTAPGLPAEGETERRAALADAAD